MSRRIRCPMMRLCSKYEFLIVSQNAENGRNIARNMAGRQDLKYPFNKIRERLALSIDL